MTILNLADDTEYVIESLIDDVDEAFKNKLITFDQVVLMHQLMWSWIYDEFCCSGTLLMKRDFWELLSLDLKVGKISNYCFFCAYGMLNQYNFRGGCMCEVCPGIWGRGCVKCHSIRSPYSKLVKMTFDKKISDPGTIANLIRDVAMVEIRKKEDADA